GEQQKTAAPKVAVINGSATITSASEGASIGYRLDNGDWQLYTNEFAITEGKQLVAKAIRYGWKESDEVAFELP
ncbi:MAG: hypothetical protein ACR2P1_28300, partial [Pseudomonadales bacterium]